MAIAVPPGAECEPVPGWTVSAGRDLLHDLDDSRHIVGVWMPNVPPFPGAA